MIFKSIDFVKKIFLIINFILWDNTIEKRGVKLQLFNVRTEEVLIAQRVK